MCPGNRQDRPTATEQANRSRAPTRHINPSAATSEQKSAAKKVPKPFRPASGTTHAVERIEMRARPGSEQRKLAETQETTP